MLFFLFIEQTPRKRAFDRYLADHTVADDDVFVRRSRPLIRPPTPPVPLSADVDRTFDGRAAKRSRHESNDRDRRPLAADTTLVKRFDNLWRHWRLTSSEPIVKNKLLDAYCMLRANDGCLVLHPRGLQADLLLRGSPRLFLAFDDNPEQFGRVREQGGRHVWSSNRLRVLTSFEDAMLDASTELRDYAAERGFRCDSKQSLYHAAAHAKNRGYHKVAAGLALSWYADTESSGSENARLPLVRLCVQPVPAYNHGMLCAAQSGRRARARLCRPQHAVRDKNEQMTLYVTRIVVDLRRILLSSSDNSHLLSYTK